MGERARLRQPSTKIVLVLPWWPSDVTFAPATRQYADLDRQDVAPLSVPQGLSAGSVSIGYACREANLALSVQAHRDTLEYMAASARPVQLLLGDRVEPGLWRFDSEPSIVVTAWASDGTASAMDVSLALKRASEASVNVGPVRRGKRRGRADNMARRV